MIHLQIDNSTVSVPAGSTVLDAAKTVGIEIPTMCYLNGYHPATSCMICMVHDLDSGKLIPACSAPANEGMRISTTDERARTSRKNTLDLLLSEHVGNCEAPCQRSCAAYMDIPWMIHHIEKQQFDSALKIVKKSIALPAVLGRICPAPCEKACNRKELDDSVSICHLKRFVADYDLEKENPYVPETNPLSGKKVAIVGAGPAGLSAAYYLRQYGHECILFDANELPGGLLRYGIPDDKLDKKVLDRELETILLEGIQFRKNISLGVDVSLDELSKDFDAVLLALGEIKGTEPFLSKLGKSKNGIEINRKTFATEIPGVFAGGNMVTPGKLAIRSLAHGRFMAISANEFLQGEQIQGNKRRFNSMTGRISSAEAEQLVAMASELSRREDTPQGFSSEEAVAESSRCFRCDCRKQVSCKLRKYADAYDARQHRFKTSERIELTLLTDHDLILFEPGKCIKCGLCVQIAERHEEELGLTFVNRGFQSRIEVPFNEMIKDGLKKAAKECAEACPTAAIVLKKTFEGEDNDL